VHIAITFNGVFATSFILLLVLLVAATFVLVAIVAQQLPTSTCNFSSMFLHQFTVLYNTAQLSEDQWKAVARVDPVFQSLA